jgi:CrcB protein
LALNDRRELAASWPWPTFVANVLGALLLGYFVTRLQERLPPNRYRWPVPRHRVCGALTTFST